MRVLNSLAFFLAFLSTVSGQQRTPKYEFRAVWVATVSNVDWPSKQGLSTSQQKQEVVSILDMHKEMGMNAIILQVRPCADALYASRFEPWSKYLSGTPGLIPYPYYDPLEFWIDECHKRDMELHAWLNPFRVSQNADEPLAGNHIAFEHPDWILKYGNKLYFDPGIPGSREFVKKVVSDIVSRYDVDAIHFDDYFYPYPLNEEFPDTTSFRLHSRGWAIENKGDWRRENVDFLIESLSHVIKSVKPWVKFGISPFGVWRNGADDPDGSDTRAGTTNYDHLFADVIKWQKKGWIDYLVPQLYWRIGHPAVDFEHLAEWWGAHKYDRSMYIGQATYKIDRASTIKEWNTADEISKQIELIRSIPEIEGSAFFSSNQFKRDLMGLQETLANIHYRQPAIIPPMPWLDSIPPAPVLALKKRRKKIKWELIPTDNELDKPDKILIYINKEGDPFSTDDSIYVLTNPENGKYKLKRRGKKKRRYEIRVSVLDRLSNESLVSHLVTMKL